VTIGETTFVLLDTETGGTEEGADLLEIAARNNRTGEVFETLVSPTRPIPPDSSGVHHLVEADFVGAPDRATALADLEAFVPAGALVVAHNAPFDQRMIAPALADRRFLCSERLAHHLVPDAPNFKLGTLYYYLGGAKIETALHRAAADLDPLDYVLARLLMRYEAWADEKCAGDEARLAKSAEIDSLLAFVARPYIMLRPPFGKYKTFDELIDDEGYCRWMLRLPDLSPDLRYNIQRAQQRRREAAA
jgi:exodeoxyribonuclease X